MRPTRFTPVTLAIALASLISLRSLRAAETVDIYFIDVEGGQATLIAAPAGESLLIDTGYAGNILDQVEREHRWVVPCDERTNRGEQSLSCNQALGFIEDQEIRRSGGSISCPFNSCN